MVVAASTRGPQAPERPWLPQMAVLDTARAQRSLRVFVEQAWHVVEPATVFLPNWHIDAICRHLEAVVRGDIRNLVVNVPPRTMKSLVVSVFFPAWRWVTAPQTRFLYASYSQTLATDHSLATRRVIESDWYRARWGDRFAMAGDQNLKTRFENDKRGARIATSVGGVTTGQGGDFAVVDDPHNVLEAESDAIRRETLRWWDTAMSTRLNDPKRGGRIIVMQRVHEDDLSGHVLAQGGYDHLSLPMEYEPTDRATAIGWRDPRTEPGEPLWPARFGPAELADLRTRLGARTYAGQFQQRPAPAEGAILKREWWRWYRSTEVPAFTKIVQAWDTAFKAATSNDWSVGTTWGMAETGYYLLDRWRARVEFPALKRAVVEEYAKCDRWQRSPRVPVEVLVEDAASGQSLVQELRAGTSLPIIPVKVDRDKVARVNSVSPTIEAGRVWLPADAAWRDELVEECAGFPFGAHDDQVDSLSLALGRMIASPAADLSGFLGQQGTVKDRMAS